MPNQQLDQFIHALEMKAVPPLVLAVLGAALLGFAFKWAENRFVRKIRSAREQKQFKHSKPHVAYASAPHCPVCNSQMIQRKARRGARAGQEFWGCLKYPDCRGTRAIS